MNQTAEPTPSRSKKPDPLVSVGKRNRELEKRTKMLLSALVAQSACLIVMGALVAYMLTHPTPPVYFVQNADGSGLAKITPLNQANTSPGAVTQLAADQLGCVNSYDFANYKNQLAQCADYFTRTGWTRFQNDFEGAGTRTAVEQRSLVVSSVLTKPPKIVGQGEIMGALFWDLEVPFTVRYQGSGYDTTQSSIAVIKVVRVPVTDNPRGIAVAQVRVANG